MLLEPFQTTIDDGIPIAEVTFVRGRPGDHRRLAGHRRDHGGGSRVLPGGRAARHVRLARRPAPTDPAVRRAADRDQRRHGLGGAADRARAAEPARVPPRRGLRRAQRVVRLRVREREPPATRVPAARGPAGLHGEAGPPGGVARRAERPAADAGPLLPHARAAVASRPRGRRGDRRGVRRSHRRRRAPRHPHARRPARGVFRAGPPQLRQDRACRVAAPLPRRLPLRGPDRSRALRRQGEGPARAREVLLLRRRAQEGTGPAGVGRGGPRRAHGRRAGGARARGAPDRTPSSRGTTRTGSAGAGTPT